MRWAQKKNLIRNYWQHWGRMILLRFYWIFHKSESITARWVHMNILCLIGDLICKHIGLWVKIYMDLCKTYCFKLEVNDLDLVMIFDTLKCMWGGCPFIMSMIRLESHAFMMSQISNLDISFRPCIKWVLL